MRTFKNKGSRAPRIILIAAAFALVLLLLSGCGLQDISYNGAPDTGPTVAAASPAPEADGSLTEPEETSSSMIREDGTYSSKEDVALYIHTYGKLPSNYITKKEAQELGWSGGSLEPYAPGRCIGGSYFGNYEGLLPSADGRTYRECDIDTLGADSRGAKRIVYSSDGLVYYTDDHYESFTLLYGDD